MLRPHVLFIGAGRMGGALLSGLFARGGVSISVIEPLPSPELKRLVRRRDVRLNPRVSDLVKAPPDLAVLAVKPQVLGDVASAHLSILSQTAVLSIAAGVTIRALRKICGTSRIVRAMPNLAVEVGQGMSVAVADRGARARDIALARDVLAAGGEVVFVRNEALMDAVTAVSGSGPAYVFHLAEALADAARKMGLPAKLARTLAKQTIIGAGALLQAGGDAKQLRRRVTSPGGTTEAALNILMATDGLSPLMRKAVTAARDRARALGH